MTSRINAMVNSLDEIAVMEAAIGNSMLDLEALKRERDQAHQELVDAVRGKKPLGTVDDEEISKLKEAITLLDENLRCTKML